MKGFEGRLGEGEILCWKLLSFFSLSFEMQVKLIGHANDWFIDKKKDKDGSSNYLFGIALTYVHCHGALRDRLFPEIVNIDILTDLIRDMLEQRDLETWSIYALDGDERWREVRMYATDILNEAGLPLSPPKKPFQIEKLIEVDGYR